MTHGGFMLRHTYIGIVVSYLALNCKDDTISNKLSKLADDYEHGEYNGELPLCITKRSAKRIEKIATRIIRLLKCPNHYQTDIPIITANSFVEYTKDLENP